MLTLLCRINPTYILAIYESKYSKDNNPATFWSFFLLCTKRTDSRDD